MRKIAAILLIAIFLFNIIGYKLVFGYLEQKATQRLEQKIDSGQYTDDQLLEIKIPLQIAYYTDTKYEACYGEIEFKGEHYRFVKRKINDGILHLLCIPHKEKDNIAAVKTDFVKSVNDEANNNTPQKQNQTSFVKLLLSEFLQEERSMDPSLHLFATNNLHAGDSYLIAQFEPNTLAQPPENL